VGSWSLGSLIGGYIRELEDLAPAWKMTTPPAMPGDGHSPPDMMLAYSLAARPVIDKESATRSLRHLIDDDGWPYAEVIADIGEHREYWRMKHGYLERYRRLTVAQAMRPEVRDLPWQRAACLALEYREGTGPGRRQWAVRSLASETRPSHARVTPRPAPRPRPRREQGPRPAAGPPEPGRARGGGLQ
jgi:hypothetical protein